MMETLAQIHNYKYNKRPASPRLAGRNRGEHDHHSNSYTQTHTSRPVRTRTISDSSTFLKVNSAVNMLSIHPQQDQIKRGSSFVTGQKLRESKWFNENEFAIFCAVVETGFILEQKTEENPESKFGIAVWKPGFEKSKNADYLTIHTLTEQKGKTKVTGLTVKEFWPEGTKLRINNKSDRTEKPLDEPTIRNQLSVSQNSKRKWHNSEHFTYFCRYGPVESHFRVKSITDHLKQNTETFFLLFRTKSTK